MKKLFYAVVALSLFATSCAKDDAAKVEGNTKTVSFSIKAPVMQTRSDGTAATKLYYAFYDENGAILTGLPCSTTGETWDGITGKTINVTLVEGKTYSAIFWAQNPEAPYTPDIETAKKVTLDYETMTGNSTNYDAFWKYVGGISTTNSQAGNILLERPFAKLKIGASEADVEAGEKAGLTVSSAKVVIAGVANEFNLVDGSVSGEELLTYNWASVENASPTTFTYTPTGGTATTYDIFSTNYILVSGESGKALTTVTLSLNNTSNDTGAVTRVFESVPIERNHKTYILGDIVTGGTAANTFTYTVKINPIFPEDDIVDEQ